MGFKEKYTENERLNESTKICLKYPTRVPIIVEKYSKCSFNEINKNKYLVPKDTLMSQFLGIIRKRIDLNSSQALFIMVNKSLIPINQTLGEIYENNKDTDGFLYMTYTSENTFG